MSRNPAYEYYTLSVLTNSELFFAIQKEAQRTGSSPAIAARAMLNRFIQQRDLLAVSEARIRQLEELILMRPAPAVRETLPVVVEPDVIMTEELVTDVVSNADEALDAWD